MARKILIDCDPGIDDAVALCLALFDPRLEVLAVTAVEGNAHAEQTSRNVQAIVEQLDPPRYPRFGTGQPPESPPSALVPSFHGSNGLGEASFPVSLLHHEHPSDKVICDVVRADPGNVTLVTLGPLTNIARAIQRDAELPTLIRDIVILGGSVNNIGNVTPSAEFNMFYDPMAADVVFRSPTTKTLLPLDVTRKIIFSMGFLDELPSEESRVGQFLHEILPYCYRAHRQKLGLEGIYLHDAIALVAVLQPELFQMSEMHGQVEIGLGLTRGTTVFDRREFPKERPNMEVATSVDKAEVKAAVLRGLKYAGQES